MPQRCSIPGCRTGYKQGLMLLCYPKDPGRRCSWIEGVRKAGLEPTNMQFICELHFGPDQWEKVRVDGTRKLKWSGVPNMFSPDELAATMEIVRAVAEVRQRHRGSLKRKGSEEIPELPPKAKSVHCPSIIRRVVKIDNICQSIQATPPSDSEGEFKLPDGNNVKSSLVGTSIPLDKTVKLKEDTSFPLVTNLDHPVKSPSINSTVSDSVSQPLKSDGSVVKSCTKKLLEPLSPVADVAGNYKPCYVESHLPLSGPSHAIVVQLPKSRFQNSLIGDLEDVKCFLTGKESAYEQRLINAISELTKKHQLLDEKIKKTEEVVTENSILKEKLIDHDKVLIENYKLKEKLREIEQRSIVKNVFCKEKVGVTKESALKIERQEKSLPQSSTDCDKDYGIRVKPLLALVSSNNCAPGLKDEVFVSLDNQL